MNTKIKFIAENEETLEILPKPYPALNKLPNWIHEMDSYVNGEKDINDEGDPTSTIKKCVPVLDSITAGYHIPLHSDVWVENDGEDINIKWSLDDIKVVSVHDQVQYHSYPVPEGYEAVGFKWINPWIVKTPPGWSCMFTHPIHQEDLPFKCLTAIVDTDRYPSCVNFIFFIKKGFSGLIPKETPIIQIIPIKRSTFKSEYSHDSGFLKQQWEKAHCVFFDRYKKFFHVPKIYKKGDIRKCPFAFLHK
jgi:hypothetical protein